MFFCFFLQEYKKSKEILEKRISRLYIFVLRIQRDSFFLFFSLSLSLGAAELQSQVKDGTSEDDRKRFEQEITELQELLPDLDAKVHVPTPQACHCSVCVYRFGGDGGLMALDV